MGSQSKRQPAASTLQALGNLFDKARSIDTDPNTVRLGTYYTKGRSYDINLNAAPAKRRYDFLKIQKLAVLENELDKQIRDEEFKPGVKNVFGSKEKESRKQLTRKIRELRAELATRFDLTEKE